MKRTAREKNSIIITFIFYVVLVSLVLLFISFNTIGKIEEIELKKDATSKLYSDIVNIESVGLSFNEFKLLSNSGTGGTKEDNEILNNISEDFYNKHLKNNTENSFKLFIKEKTEELSSDKNTKLISDNEKQIINILPTYSEDNLSVDQKHLTDFQFINYIESIIDSFNLTTNSSLGIGNLVLLDDYAISSKKGESLDSNIYYIPLNINLEGKKSDIIDFLYFIEHVGNIDIKNNEILINKDNNFLSTNGFSKVLSGDKYSEGYNIFENQIIDINDFTMTNYIDSSYLNRNNQDFIGFVKDSQGEQEFDIKVNMFFYVKGQPKYLVLNSIQSTIKDFNSLSVKINGLINKGEIKGIELLKLKKNQNLLKNIKTKVASIQLGLRKQEELEILYKRSIEINDLIQPLCEKMEGICK